MRRVLQTAPTAEPLTVAEVKTHLRVEIVEDDALIGLYLSAARQWAETFTRRAFMVQTWDLYLDEWPEDDEIELPFPPTQSVSYVKYDDGNGVEQTLVEGTDYVLSAPSHPEAGRAVIVPAYGKEFPTARESKGAIRIRVVAGYASAAAVPGPIKAAILLHVGHLYANREAAVVGTVATEVPFTVKSLLTSYRSFRVA